MAGIHWCNEKKVAIDNHTHKIEILGIGRWGSPGIISNLLTDIEIVNILKQHFNIEIALNSISKLLYDAIAPSQYDKLVKMSANTQASSYIINAKILNLIEKHGPTSDIFDKIYDSSYVPDFRRFINQKNISEAGNCYIEIANEINSATKRLVQNKARELRPIKGIANIIIDLVLDAIGIGVTKKTLDWYLNSTTAQPHGAAAFLLDLRND